MTCIFWDQRAGFAEGWCGLFCRDSLDRVQTKDLHRLCYFLIICHRWTPLSTLSSKSLILGISWATDCNTGSYHFFFLAPPAVRFESCLVPKIQAVICSRSWSEAICLLWTNFCALENEVVPWKKGDPLINTDVSSSEVFSTVPPTAVKQDFTVLPGFGG